MKSRTKKVDAIILAAGWLGHKKLFPKALMEIGDETLLEKQVQWLRPFANKIIVSCTTQEAVQIRAYHPELKLTFAATPDLPGTAGSLKHAIPHTSTDSFLVVNVDDITDIDLPTLIDFGPNTVCVANPRLHYGMIEIENQEIKSFREKPLLKDLWVSCGVYLLNKSIAAKLPERGNIAKDVFPYLKLRAYKHFGVWRTIANHHDHSQ